MREFRQRARQACVACNAKRVKCNVTEELPCRNCVDRSLQCEVRESRRGKHPRPASRKMGTIYTPNSGDKTRKLSPGCSPQAAAEGPFSSRPAGRHEPLPGRNGYAKPTPEQPEHTRSDSDVHTEESRSVFLGESTSVRYVNDLRPDQESDTPQSMGFVHKVPDNSAESTSFIQQLEMERRRSKRDWLSSNNVFDFPRESHTEVLLHTYFDWFHPYFSIVDEPETWQQVRQGTLSPLLLNAILMVAVIHSDEDNLLSMSLGGQTRAKYTFYNRAKDIYDADYETQTLTVMQSLFLLSFWRAGPLLEKDSRHWLAAAISLAQSRALHRTADESDTRNDGLRKRIWWSIYVRERQCATALGLPHRIRDEDCDVGILKHRDFNRAFVSSLAAQSRAQYIAYQIGMAELSGFLGQIVHSGYLPGKPLTNSRKESLRFQLAAWKEDLPMNMQLDHDFERPASFHVCMLHLAYNNLIVLLHRSSYLENHPGTKDGPMALQAASRTSRIIEDLLPEGNLRHAQVHVITNLFNALCIHTIHLRRAEGTGMAIAEHRAKMCLLGLEELQKTWEMQNWILQLFFQYLDRATASRLLASRNESQRGSPCPSSPGTRRDCNADKHASSVPESQLLAWSTEQQNHFLFSHIENSFSFGEASMYDWNIDSVSATPQLGDPSGSGTWAW